MTRTPLFSVSIKDCEVQTFKAGGHGGQRKDNTETAVRIIHAPSGAVGISREDRLQINNKRKAFERMANSQRFQRWLRIETARRIGKETVEQRVNRMMNSANLKIEVRNEEGKWVEQSNFD
jgi:protein subunit release factor A